MTRVLKKVPVSVSLLGLTKGKNCTSWVDRVTWGYSVKQEPNDTWLDAADDDIINPVDSCKIGNFEILPFHKSTCIYRTVWYIFDSRSAREYLCADKKDKQQHQLVHHKHENFLGEIQSRGFVNSHADDYVGFPSELDRLSVEHLSKKGKKTLHARRDKKNTVSTRFRVKRSTCTLRKNLGCTAINFTNSENRPVYIPMPPPPPLHSRARKKKDDIDIKGPRSRSVSERERERETRDSTPTDSYRRGADRRRPNKTNGHAPRLYEVQVCLYVSVGSHGAMIRSAEADTRTNFFHYYDYYYDYYYYINANPMTKVLSCTTTKDLDLMNTIEQPQAIMTRHYLSIII
uniref:Uncharacterized protein n=1 Tax=Trichogramma kaykai TaxID=54128 RepID=A0ABD2W276_9HYME